ncbi:MAG: hypothetical protein JW827_10995, partial [Spirochaetes bacterium]|nr:hypothetical protein [Spirochaetota bacterium]
GGVTVRCINVNGYVTGYGFSSATDDNGRSIGITVSYNSFSIWIGGDTTIRVENAIVASSLSSNELDMDVYLANHHGDNDGNQLDGDGNSQNFINRLKPEAAIISAGSQYDNPNANCVNYLIGVGAYIYQTCYDPGQYDIPPGNGIVFNQDGNSTGDYDGDIKIETDGSTYSVSGRITPAGIYVSNTYTAGGGIGSVSFTPSTLLNNGIDRVKVEAVISLDPSLISNVTMDWSSLGGTNTETLYDDGTHGDSISNDSIYTFTNIYSTSNEGTYPVGITVVKKDASTVVKTVNLTLVEDRFAPFAEDFYLKLTNSGIRLSWINPVEEDFDYLMVRYDTGPASFPETINEGTFLYKQTNNSASEYFHSPIQFYKKYFYTIFFIDVKGNTTKLQRSILVTPTDEKDFARISDNLIKPEDEQQVEIVFHDSVISTFPEISVYNALGDQVRDMKVDPSSLDASNNSVRWDLTDSNGQKVGSGLYYIVISTSKGQLKYKVLVVR